MKIIGEKIALLALMAGRAILTVDAMYRAGALEGYTKRGINSWN